MIKNFYLLQLEEDMENYVKFKLMGGIKKLKPNVVPHIFDCQLDIPISSVESTSTSSIEDSSSVQIDQNNTHSDQLLSENVNESPEQSTIAVTETCVKVRSEYIYAVRIILICYS